MQEGTWPAEHMLPPLRGPVARFSLCGVRTYLDHPVRDPRAYITDEDREMLANSSEYLTGNKKRDLTRWWLQHIEDRVDAYIAGQGYAHDAVPYHYIDQPPKSLRLIQTNLNIIHAILSDLKISPQDTTTTTTTQPIQRTNGTTIHLLTPIKKEVYDVIGPFRQGMLLVLWDQLNTIDPDTFVFPNDPALLDTARQFIQTQPRSDRMVELRDLVHDVDYIDEMGSMEDTFFQALASGTPGPADIVPVTGLVVGRLHRLENELKTVITHWQGRVPN